MNKKKQSVSENLIDQTVSALHQIDETAALERVNKLRELYPEVAPEALVGMLIKQKCLQTGAIGRVSSSASIVPDVGVFVSLIFGEEADVSLTTRMQGELVQEIAAAFGSDLSAVEKQEAVVLVTGKSSGATQLLDDLGGQLAQQATSQLSDAVAGTTQLEVADNAARNMLATYLIGQRAQTYFREGAEAVAPWEEQMAALGTQDTQTMVTWLNETTTHSWKLLSNSAMNIADVAIVTGQSLGEVLLVNIKDSALGRTVEATAAHLPLDVTAGTELAGKTATEVGRNLAIGVRAATNLAGEVGKIAGDEVVAGVGKLGKTLGGWLKGAEKK